MITCFEQVLASEPSEGALRCFQDAVGPSQPCIPCYFWAERPGAVPSQRVTTGNTHTQRLPLHLLEYQAQYRSSRCRLRTDSTTACVVYIAVYQQIHPYSRDVITLCFTTKYSRLSDCRHTFCGNPCAYSAQPYVAAAALSACSVVQGCMAVLAP